MRAVYDGLTILMNYTADKEEPELEVARGWFWADGPGPDGIEEVDQTEITSLGWGWNTIREKWMFNNGPDLADTPECFSLGDCTDDCPDEGCPAHPVNDEEGEG